MIEMYLNGSPWVFFHPHTLNRHLPTHTHSVNSKVKAHTTYTLESTAGKLYVFSRPAKRPENVDTIGEPGVGLGLPWFYARLVC